MRFAVFAMFLVFSSLIIGANAPEWIPSSWYVPSAELSKALAVAKTWAAEKIDSEKDIDYEYSVSETESGYTVRVQALYPNSTGGYNVAVDGQMCLYLNRSFELEKARQCIAAWEAP